MIQISQPSDFVHNETPAGVIDGVNVTFSLSNAPAPPASLLLFLNGILQVQGVNYSLSGTVVTYLSGAPSPGDSLTAFYMR